MTSFSLHQALLFRRHKAFIIPFLALWIVLCIVQFFFTQREIVLTINDYNSPIADQFFWLVTALGNGIFIMGVATLVFFYSKRQSVIIVLGYLVSGLIVQGSKKYVFLSMQRPSTVLSDIFHSLHAVDGVHFFTNNSFPSGHAASAFTMFATLAFMSKHSLVQFIYLLLACLVAYSRLYLLQHFLRDVFAGAMVGVFVATLLQLVFDKYRILRKW